MALLSVAAVLLFEFGFVIASLVTVVGIVVIFALESVEMIQLDPVKQRQLVGMDCLVTMKITKTERGIVKVYDPYDRKFSSELWSAESASSLEEGTVARVVGMRSIILLVAAESKEK